MRFRLTLVGCALLLALAGCSSEQGIDPIAKHQLDMFNLARMNGCIDCHRVDATVVGPSWKAIAERYKEAPLADARALLIESVKKGSKGKYLTWKGGDGMPPLERRVSAKHIEELVDYILTLR